MPALSTSGSCELVQAALKCVALGVEHRLSVEQFLLAGIVLHTRY